MSVECATLTRARQIAQEKGFLKKGEELFCPYSEECDGTSCPLSKEERWRTIYFKQGKESATRTPKDIFYSRLEKTIEMRKNAGY